MKIDMGPEANEMNEAVEAWREGVKNEFKSTPLSIINQIIFNPYMVAFLQEVDRLAFWSVKDKAGLEYDLDIDYMESVSSVVQARKEVYRAVFKNLPHLL